jgi:two-component system cell cycle response regulator DivK
VLEEPLVSPELPDRTTGGDARGLLVATILVVEETQDNFDLIADALEDTHRILHARTGPEALVQARQLHPDLILLSMSLPEMSGCEVARCLKAEPLLAAIPVIALITHATNEDRQSCIDAGCEDCIAKPISVRQLVTLTGRYLNRQAALVTE